MGKRHLSATLVAVLVGGLLTVTAAGAAAGSSSEASFLAKLNEERRARGLRTLVAKADLDRVAERHSARMKSAGSIYHNANLANDVRGNWRRLGENVGTGYGVGSLHAAFMDSAPHRANVLGKDFNQVGIGVVNDDDVIYVTFVFAKRDGATASAPAKKKKATAHRAKAERRDEPAARPSAEAKPKPKPKPEPKAEPQPEPKRETSEPKRSPSQPQTVTQLVRMMGLDADFVDAAAGYTAG